MAQLQLYPHDPYLQYVLLMLADRENAKEKIVPRVQAFAGIDLQAERTERAEVSISLVSSRALWPFKKACSWMRCAGGSRTGRPAAGALAGEAAAGDPSWDSAKCPWDSTKRPCSASSRAGPRHSGEGSSLAGPTIRSHPWQEMLAGRKPAISPLALCVPEDFYFIDFRSLNRLLEAIQISDLWGTHLFNQTAQEARTQQTGERLREQLAVETHPLLQPFYDLVVERVGVTGSDLFVRRGKRRHPALPLQAGGRLQGAPGQLPEQC